MSDAVTESPKICKHNNGDIHNSVLTSTRRHNSGGKSFQDFTEHYYQNQNKSTSYISNSHISSPVATTSSTPSSSSKAVKKLTGAVKRLHGFGRRSRSQGPVTRTVNVQSNSNNIVASLLAPNQRASLTSNEHINLITSSVQQSSPLESQKNTVNYNDLYSANGVPRKPRANYRDYTDSNIYGIELAALKFSNEDIRGRIIPEIIAALGAQLINYAETVEGIFRLSPTNRNVKKLRERLELASKQSDSFAQYKEELHSASDPHATATLLKHLLRDLPTSLIPDDVYPNFLNISNAKSEANLQNLRNCIQRLPKINSDVLHYLVELMLAVANCESVNKMSPQALSVVFGPNIFRVSDGINGLKEQALTNKLVLRMIENYPQLFLQTSNIASGDNNTSFTKKLEPNVSSDDSAICISQKPWSPTIKSLIKDRLDNFIYETDQTDNNNNSTKHDNNNLPDQNFSNQKHGIPEPTSPKSKVTAPGRRRPSKALREKMITRTDVFNEFTSRNIHNIGRVESIRNENIYSKKSTNTFKTASLKTSKSSPDSLVVSKKNKSPLPPPNQEQFEMTERLVILRTAIDEILERIVEKRILANRPTQLELMTDEDLLTEKADLQKELLNFESTYGRPVARKEKDIVRGVYDRYRAVKRYMATKKLITPSESLDSKTMTKVTLSRNHSSVTQTSIDQKRDDHHKTTNTSSNHVRYNTPNPVSPIPRIVVPSDHLVDISVSSPIEDINNLKNRVDKDRIATYNKITVLVVKIAEQKQKVNDKQGQAKLDQLVKEKKKLEKHYRDLRETNNKLEELILLKVSNGTK